MVGTDLTLSNNQIRGRFIKRALKLTEIENKPRYQSIKWFLDVINLDFDKTIKRSMNSRLAKYKIYI